MDAQPRPRFRMERVLARTLPWLGCLGLFGCSSVSPPPLLLPLARHGIDPVTFPRSAEILDGFDAPGPDNVPVPGDEVLFGIAIDAPDERGIWYLRIRLLPPDMPRRTWRQPIRFGKSRQEVLLESDLAPIEVTLYDDALQVLYGGTTLIPEKFFSHGLMLTLRDKDAPPDVVAQAWAYMGIAAFAQALGQFEAFEHLVWKIVDKPPIWTMLTGVSLTLEFDDPISSTLAHPALLVAGTTQAVQVPMALVMNGRTALRLSVLAGPAIPPIGLCAGTLSIEGESPTRSEARVRAKLLAARRGPLLAPE